MPNTTLAAKVACPCYKRDNPQNCCIVCEGQKGCRSLQLNFTNKAELKAYAAAYCLKDFDSCPVFSISKINM